MIRFCLLLLLAAFASAADRPELPPNLTLPQALDIALTNSTNIRTAVAQLQEASGQYQQSRSPLRPQIDVGIRQSYQTVNLVGAGIPVFNETGLIGPFGSMGARELVALKVATVGMTFDDGQSGIWPVHNVNISKYSEFDPLGSSSQRRSVLLTHHEAGHLSNHESRHAE
jgi:hypothetical protein